MAEGKKEFYAFPGHCVDFTHFPMTTPVENRLGIGIGYFGLKDMI